MPQQQEPKQKPDPALAEFDRLMGGGADPALDEFDKLMGSEPAGGSTKPPPASAGVDLGNPPGRQSTVKPEAGREPGWWASNFGSAKKAKPLPKLRGGYDRFGEGSAPREYDDADTRKPIDVRRRTGDLKPVVIEADPERVTVSRKDRVKRDWAPAVKAETAEGYERQATGQPTNLNRGVQGKQNFNAAGLRAEAEAARMRAARLRETGRVEDKNMADDLEARAFNTELLVERTVQTDTFGGIARRNATFGLSDASEQREIADIRNRDLALSEEDQTEGGRVSPIGYERPFEWGRDLGAPMAGQLPTIIATGIAGRAAAAGVGRLAAARGLTRTANIANRLSRAIETPGLVRPAGIGEHIEHFIGQLPTMQARGAVEGNLVGALTDANVERIRGNPDWAKVGIESFAMGAVTGAIGEPLFEGAGRIVGGVLRKARPRNIVEALTDFGREKTPVVDRLPETDKLPEADRMPEARGKFGAVLEDLLEQRQAAEPEVVTENYRGVDRRRPSVAEDEERYAVDTHGRRERRRLWEEQRHRPDFVSPPRRVWDQAERDAFHAEQMSRHKPWNVKPLHPDEAEALFARGATEEFPWQKRERLAREQAPPARVEPEAPPSMVDNFDMSKNVERIEAEADERAALDEQERVVAEAEARGEIPPSRTPEERLARAKARYDEITKNVPIKKIAFGTAAAAAAADDEDNAGPAAAAALALTTGRVGRELESVIQYRLSRGASIGGLARTYGIPRSAVHEIAERFTPPELRNTKRGAAIERLERYEQRTGKGEPLLRDEKARLAENRAGGSGKKLRSTGPLSDIVQEHVESSRTGGGERTPYSDRTTTVSLQDVMEAANQQNEEQGLRLLKVKNMLRQLGLTEAADRVRKEGGRFILPAALLAATGTTEDDDKKLALAGAAALTTGRIHGDQPSFHSRMAREVANMRGQWAEGRPAGDWIGKLGNATAFSKEEFNRVLKPFLEKAKAEKRKVTTAEVVEVAEKGAFRLALERRGEGGRDITSPRPEPPPPPPVTRRAPVREELNWEDIEGAEEGEGYHVLHARQDHEERVQEARREFEEAERTVTNERDSLWGVVSNAGVSRRAFDNALARADDGEGGINQSQFMDYIRDHVDQPEAEGADAPTLGEDSSYTVVEHEDDDGETIFKVVHQYEPARTRGVGFTRLEALAEHQNVHGNEQLGNLSEILGSQTDYRVEQHPQRNGMWAIIDGTDEILMEARTRNELVEAWVAEKYDGSEIDPPENGDLDTIDSYADDYARALSRYNDTESETYGLREGEDDWDEALEEARQEDRDEAEEAARVAREAREELETSPILNEPPWDEEFYELTEAEQERVREGIRRGAVGTRAPFYADEVQPHGLGHDARADADFIFDPAIPHTPFPREKQTVRADPQQLDMFGRGQRLPFTLPARVPTILKVAGETKFHGSQRTPGGSNYREITFVWDNPPGTLPPEHQHTVAKIPRGEPSEGYWAVFKPDGSRASQRPHYYKNEAQAELGRIHATKAQELGLGTPLNFVADHYAGDPPNVQVWGRLDEHVYVEGASVHPAVRALLDERAAASKEMNEIAAEFEVLNPGGAPPTPATATPEMMTLARRYQAVQEKVNRLDEDYNSAISAGHGPGTYKQTATNIVEAQSDLKQSGEAGGYFNNDPLTPERVAELAEQKRVLAEQRAAIDVTYRQKLAEWDATESGQRLKHLDDEYYRRTFSADDWTEYTRLRDERDTVGSERDRQYHEDIARNNQEQEVIRAALHGQQLLPGEAERLAKNIAKVRERVRVATEALNTATDVPARNKARAERDAAETRLQRLLRAKPVPDTPFKDTHVVYGLVASGALKEAAHADSDLLTWSHSTNRESIAGLPIAAAKITYDDALTNGVKKMLKLLGFDVKPEVIDMDGYKHWMVKLTPAMKAAIKKASFPMLGALGLLAAPSEAKAQDGSDEEKPSMIPYLIAAGMVAGAWKTLPREMRARLAARAKAGGYEKKGGVIFHANPIPDAMRALKRAPTTAAVGAIAAYAANSDNPDIRDTAPWVFGLAALHTIGSKNLKSGGKVVTKAIVEGLRKTETGTALVRLANPAALIHPDAQAAILAFEALKAKGTARQIEYTAKLKALGPLGDRIVSDFIEGENFEAEADVKALSADEIHAIVMVAQSAAEEVERGTQMQIAAGALHPESALSNYLPGKYAYWEALDALTEKAPRGKGSSQAVRISPIKKRTIPREEIEARNKLGEIREASYRVGVAIEKAYSRSAAAVLFKTLRAIPDVIHPEYQSALDDFLVAKDLMRVAKQQNNTADIATAQTMLDAADLKRRNISTRFKLRGGDYVTMPETKSMGVLSGMVVQRDIANELNGLPERRTTDRLMRFWKQAKTVFNPGTHVANAVSNTTLAHMGGMRMTEQPIWLAKAGRDMHNYGRGARALAESGQADLNAVTAGSAGTTARSARSEEGLSELMQTTRPETAKVLRDVGIRDPKAELTPTFNKAMQATRNLYNDEDNIFRVAMYLKATSPKSRKLTLSDANGLGMSHADALKHVQETFGNFRTRSPLLRAIRGSVAPFILYPVKVLPVFAKNIVDHPLRYLTLVAMWGALNEYSKSEVGEIPEEDLDEQDRKKYGYFFPGLTQLPFGNEAEGSRATTSLARWTPLSGATDVSQPGVSASAISPNWPKILTPSGPLTDIYGKFVSNIDTYRRKPIYSAEKPLKRNLLRALEDVIQIVGPTAAGFHRERIMDDIENEDWDAAKTDMLALLGMRPRYIRPFAQVERAGYTREDAQTDARRELKRGLDKSKSEPKDEKLLKQFDEYMEQIEKNYERRAFPPPR